MYVIAYVELCVGITLSEDCVRNLLCAYNYYSRNLLRVYKYYTHANFTHINYAVILPLYTLVYGHPLV